MSDDFYDGSAEANALLQPFGLHSVRLLRHDDDRRVYEVLDKDGKSFVADGEIRSRCLVRLEVQTLGYKFEAH